MRPTLSNPDDDPYLWLEKIDDAAALAWVERQNAQTLAKFGGTDFDRDRDTLAAIYDRPDKIPFVRRRGNWIYNFWTDENNPRGLWRRTTLASFREQNPDWQILLDVDALSQIEGEEWVWQGATTLPSEHRLAMVRLSRGGSDAGVLREYDTEKGDFVSGGFLMPEAKTLYSWLDENAILLASALGEGMATKSGYGRTVRLWERDQDPLEAEVIFETEYDSMLVAADLDRSMSPATIWFVEQTDFFDLNFHIGDRTGPNRKLDLPTDIMFESHGEWFVVSRRTPWKVGGSIHREGTLLGGKLQDLIAGKPNFQILFEPTDRCVLKSFFWCGGELILSILDELQPKIRKLTPADNEWQTTPIFGLPENGVIDMWALDEDQYDGDGSIAANGQDPLTPSTFFLVEKNQSPAILKQAPQTFSTEGSVITRHEAISIDGERIPYTQVGPAQNTGDAPVHMSGYGGFEISQLPYYNAAIGKLWLERGGISVTANIRGGGEFGPRWHEAGKNAAKKISHDDFAAVARDLVNRGVTKPSRIAAEGGSNGGLLIANMLTRYPECFGALFCTIPLIDMRRYTKLLAGASWIAEYGDPDKPEDWEFLKTYSAYHLATPDQNYPPILIATTRKDDRVHPGHARKMVEKLQSMGYDAYFYEPAQGGHGFGTTSKERAEFTSLGLNFLRNKIGWS